MAKRYTKTSEFKGLREIRTGLESPGSLLLPLLPLSPSEALSSHTPDRCPRNFLRSVITSRKQVRLTPRDPDTFPTLSHVMVGKPVEGAVSLRSKIRMGTRRNALLAAATSLAELRERIGSTRLSLGAIERPLAVKWEPMLTERPLQQPTQYAEENATSRWMQTEDEWDCCQEAATPVVRRTFDCTVIPDRKRARVLKRTYRCTQNALASKC